MSKSDTPAAVPVEPSVRHSRELGFTVVAVPHSHHVEFKVYEIEGWRKGQTPGVFDVPLWHRDGASTYPDTVDTLEEASLYLHGSVKWDGCSNWYFDEQDSVMLHGCCRRDVLRLGEVMAMCWDWAADICPFWNA